MSNQSQPDRNELVALVRQAQTASACIMDFDGLMTRLEEKTGSTEIGRWIFDPPDGKPLTAEEIVDRVFPER